MVSADHNPLAITDATFEAEVLKSTLPVLLDVWAPWCPPCRMIAPFVNEIAAEYAGRLKVGKLNVDENPRVAALLGINSIPVLIVFKEGRPVSAALGVRPKAGIEELLTGFV